jgi:hypothetical protein
LSLSAKAQAAAEAAAKDDAALLDALTRRDSDPETRNDPAPAEPESQGQTLGEQYLSVVNLIADAKKTTRLTEATLIKAWELNLMWVINSRQLAIQEAAQAQRSPFGSGYPTEIGDEGNGEVDLPEPNETITEDAGQDDGLETHPGINTETESN